MITLANGIAGAGICLLCGERPKPWYDPKHSLALRVRMRVKVRVRVRVRLWVRVRVRVDVRVRVG